MVYLASVAEMVYLALEILRGPAVFPGQRPHALSDTTAPPAGTSHSQKTLKHFLMLFLIILS